MPSDVITIKCRSGDLSKCQLYESTRNCLAIRIDAGRDFATISDELTVYVSSDDEDALLEFLMRRAYARIPTTDCSGCCH